MVGCQALDSLTIDSRADWIRQTKKEPGAALPGFRQHQLVGLNEATHLGL